MLLRPFTAVALFVTPLAVSAQGFADKLRQGASQAAAPAGLNNSPTLTQIIGNVIFFLLGLVGIIMFLYFFYAGFLYLTSQGNKDKVAQAQGIMKNTVIGLVIILVAYALTNFILSAIVGNVLQTG